MAALFRQHVAMRQKTTEQALKECRAGGLVLDAGTQGHYFEDDLGIAFRTYHHFAHWCPLSGEGHLLCVRPGQRPKLLVHRPDDYWHERNDLADGFWTQEFDIEVHASRRAAMSSLGDAGDLVYLGQDQGLAAEAGFSPRPKGLLARLNWERSFKSDYEVRCVEKATARAAKGHVAAREAFFAGGSELDIHHAYLRAIRATDDALPYGNIVCLNEKAAILHYQRKRDKTRLGRSFLIDAGARYKGYNADITRSYAADNAPDVFRSLLAAMNKLQLGLCTLIKPGLSFERLHAQAHQEIARLLLDHDILRDLTVEAAVESGLTKAFFPHGLGHMLGLCTHDVGAKQSDRLGTPQEPSSRWPHLRTARILDAGHLITVEPGVYFIPVLLTPLLASPEGRFLNGPLVDLLRPVGGIRIEDDVLVTRSGHRNLTRDHLP